MLQRLPGGSTGGGASSTVPTSAGVSTGGSSSNSGNVRLLTRVSSGFTEDLCSSGRYSVGTLHHFRVLRELSCPVHDMSATDEMIIGILLTTLKIYVMLGQPHMFLSQVSPLRFFWIQVQMVVHFL